MSEERRRFKQSRPLSERLIEEAASLRAQANLPDSIQHRR